MTFIFVFSYENVLDFLHYFMFMKWKYDKGLYKTFKRSYSPCYDYCVLQGRDKLCNGA